MPPVATTDQRFTRPPRHEAAHVGRSGSARTPHEPDELRKPSMRRASYPPRPATPLPR
ncbi:hypothetical protein B0H17DRAFT_1082126 [Mycena rosella]|uniref:Uncharacterized protein n=1 Tax=Mycena rosella TaxID=1033263 RepID=A0AAD7D229_MYCRO|nr:hypothetical protein B0H17DRAFT_1082126 [Mycena rosella]